MALVKPVENRLDQDSRPRTWRRVFGHRTPKKIGRPTSPASHTNAEPVWVGPCQQPTPTGSDLSISEGQYSYDAFYGATKKGRAGPPPGSDNDLENINSTPWVWKLYTLGYPAPALLPRQMTEQAVELYTLGWRTLHLGLAGLDTT